MLAHWNNSSRIDTSPRSDTLFGFRANQSLLFLLNAACWAEKLILLSLVWPDQGSNPQSTALEASRLIITQQKIVIKITIVFFRDDRNTVTGFFWQYILFWYMFNRFVEDVTCRDFFLSYLSDFSYFLRSNIDHLKEDINSFSYFSLIFSYFIL